MTLAINAASKPSICASTGSVTASTKANSASTGVKQMTMERTTSPYIIQKCATNENASNTCNIHRNHGNPCNFLQKLFHILSHYGNPCNPFQPMFNINRFVLL